MSHDRLITLYITLENKSALGGYVGVFGTRARCTTNNKYLLVCFVISNHKIYFFVLLSHIASHNPFFTWSKLVWVLEFWLCPPRLKTQGTW